jgi:hypothetical protein
LYNLRICGKLIPTLFCAVLFFVSANSRNYFSPYASAFEWSSVPVCLSHEGKAPRVKQFEMLEIGFELPPQLEALTDDPRHGINPFDPADIDVVAVFTNGTRSDTVYGFYYREFVRDPSTVKEVYENCPEAKWLEEFTAYKWRVRFATGETGSWNVSVKVHVKKNKPVTYVIDPFAFEVISSQHSGFLAVGKDKRHFTESRTNQSFFPLGQDIAWPDGTRFKGAQHPDKPYVTSGGYIDIQQWAANLAWNGGNTIRIVNVPWSYEFEWDTVGVYNMARAWELDSLFASCESNEIKIMFCMEHGTYTLYPWYEEHLTWSKHPYNRFIPGVEHPEDFLTDSAARMMYKRKLRYFFSRWGYSSSLGIFQILSEMDNWTFGKPATQLEDSKELQQINLAWHNEMLAFAKRQVAYRPLLTGTSYGDPPRNFRITAFSSPYVDVVCPRHCYFTERYDNLKRWGEINGVSIAEPGIHDLFPGKPAMIDETGMGMLVGDPGDMDASTDVIYHNALWATSFSGTAGAGLYWWSWNRNDYREANFTALRSFFRNVDFESSSFTRPGHWEDAGRASKVSIETFYITTDDTRRSQAMGWAHNASYWWGNISQQLKDRNGKMMEINSRTGDDAKISSPTELPEGTKFEVHDLANGAVYELAWYNTRGAGGQSGYEEYRTNIFGTAKIAWRRGEADWGYKLQRKNGSASSTTVVLPPDTVAAGEVINVCGNHPMDSLGTFAYHWDFGNGVRSCEKNTAAVYTAGRYTAVLTCVSASGEHYRVIQRIVVRTTTDPGAAPFAAHQLNF